MKNVVFPLLTLLLFSGCKKNSDVNSNLIDTNNPGEVAKVLIYPSGGEEKAGSPPASSTSKAALGIEIDHATAQKNSSLGTSYEKTNQTGQTVAAYPGSRVTLFMEYGCNTVTTVLENDKGSFISEDCSEVNEVRRSLTASGIPYCIFRLKDVPVYRIYPLQRTMGTNGKVEFPFTLPDQLSTGSFEAEFSIVDEYGFVTNYTSTKINVTRVADADNPAKAYGCDLTKSSNKLLEVLNSFQTNFNTNTCIALKNQYQELTNAIMNCKEFTQAQKNEIKQANDLMQSLSCEGFGSGNVMIKSRIETLLSSMADS